MRVSQLEGKRIALWGWGREGQAAYRFLRMQKREWGVENGESAHPLTVFCAPSEVESVKALGDASLQVCTEATGQALSAFDVVIKSPGISPYCEAVQIAAQSGTRFIGGTQLWFSQQTDARTLCVTGTKGKSTTSALLAHLLRAAGRRTALAGNIGMPLLELDHAGPDDWVIELSSYQTRDVADAGVRPLLALVTNIFPEHLDWHGSQAQYVADKLALVTEAKPRIAVFNAQDAVLRDVGGQIEQGSGASRDRIEGDALEHLPVQAGAKVRAASQTHHQPNPSLEGECLTAPTQVVWFNTPDGWHLRDGLIYRGSLAVLDTRELPLPGTHNRSNLCGVLAALEAIGMDAPALAQHAASFQPLPNRLQTLGMRDGVRWVNDSISTTPHASLAALEVFAGQRIALLLGGHDRGLDWQAFADAMHTHAPHCIVTMGANGARIHALLQPLAEQGRLQLHAAADLPEAVRHAVDALQGQGVLLLSPGAPSFGAYKDYVARGKHFAQLGGFDPERITAIAGLGVA